MPRIEPGTSDGFAASSATAAGITPAARTGAMDGGTGVVITRAGAGAGSDAAVAWPGAVVFSFVSFDLITISPDASIKGCGGDGLGGTCGTGIGGVTLAAAGGSGGRGPRTVSSSSGAVRAGGDERA